MVNYSHMAYTRCLGLHCPKSRPWHKNWMRLVWQFISGSRESEPGKGEIPINELVSGSPLQATGAHFFWWHLWYSPQMCSTRGWIGWSIYLQLPSLCKEQPTGTELPAAGSALHCWKKPSGSGDERPSLHTEHSQKATNYCRPRYTYMAEERWAGHQCPLKETSHNAWWLTAEVSVTHWLNASFFTFY
jgi:hypothetical protein